MHTTTIIYETLKTILDKLKLEFPEKAIIETTKDAKFGDFATNIAMTLSKVMGKNPREIAQMIANDLPKYCNDIEKVEVAGPGFCNIFFKKSFWQNVIYKIKETKNDYGASTFGKNEKVLLEYVSANPTGPLHIGHGRGAAVGDSLTRLLRKTGYEVDTEYYINDAGNQMNMLGLSVWLRVKELAKKEVEFPNEYYKGDYIIDIAKEMLEKEKDLAEKNDEDGQRICFEYAMPLILEGIKNDLRTFRVEHKNWFSEKSLVNSNKVKNTIEKLKNDGHTFIEDDALFLSTEKYNDDKNRVLIKKDGSLTYFASDIAYHDDKYKRGYSKLIDIWGSDHHGYIPRMRAAISILDKDNNNFNIILIQMVNLFRNGIPITMSTRAGTFVTLEEVINEVGVDATRFMFLSRKSDSPLDFDLEIVKKHSLDNPVYYVQYAHARICAVERRANERNIKIQNNIEKNILEKLDTEEDLLILQKIANFPQMLEYAASNLAIHYVSHYLNELAGLMHSYYAKHQILVDDLDLTQARLNLLLSVKQVLQNGLEILGVSAPETM